MPQLDIMTFYIQGFSVFLSLIFCFFFFYTYFLPSLSISLFSRFLLKKKYNLDKRILKNNLRKLINRILVINAPIYNSLKQAIYILNIFFFESFRFKKVSVYTSFFDTNADDIRFLLHQSSLWEIKVFFLWYLLIFLTTSFYLILKLS